MAVVMFTRGPMNTEMYDRLNDEMGIEENPPQGLLSHHAASTGDEMLIFDVWESKEDFDRFMKAQLMPAFEAIGAPMDPEQGQGPEFAELHHEFHR